MEVIQLLISLGILSVAGMGILEFVFRNSIISGVIAMVGGLIIVPIVSALTGKTKPENVDKMFECYDVNRTVHVTENLGE